MGDLWRVRDAATFAALARAPQRARRGPVWVRWAPPPPPAVVAPAGRRPASGASHQAQPAPQVAFAIGRKVGGAVVRNQLRRRLRAVLRSLDLPAGAYLVGVSGPEAAALSYADLNSVVAEAVRAAVRR